MFNQPAVIMNLSWTIVAFNAQIAIQLNKGAIEIEQNRLEFNRIHKIEQNRIGCNLIEYIKQIRIEQVGS